MRIWSPVSQSELWKCYFQHTYNSCCWIFCGGSKSVIAENFMRHTKLFSGAAFYLHGIQVQLNIGTHWSNWFSFTSCYHLIVRCYHYYCILTFQFLFNFFLASWLQPIKSNLLQNFLWSLTWKSNLIIFALIALSFSCSSCLNRMASVKIVEASIVCVANMDVTVLCRRLQISIFTWFHCLHEVKSTIGRTCSRLSWSSSRISSVLASRCHRKYCLILTSFMVFLLGVTY